MENETWRKNLSENLSALRKKAKLTQSELGEKLNYTDKSVSKWERGEGVPDVSVLIKLSELYSVSLDELVGIATKAKAEAPALSSARHPVLRKTSILMIMGGFLIIIAFIVYLLLSLILPEYEYAWMAFIIALPCLFCAAGIWFMVWKSWGWAFGSMSVALWTLCACLNISLPMIRPGLIYAAGGLIQLVSIVICGFGVLKKSA